MAGANMIHNIWGLKKDPNNDIIGFNNDTLLLDSFVL